jgi:hypothetical protein
MRESAQNLFQEGEIAARMSCRLQEIGGGDWNGRLETVSDPATRAAGPAMTGRVTGDRSKKKCKWIKTHLHFSMIILC